MIKKIPLKAPPTDTCQVSLDWLQSYAAAWFKENVPNHGQIWFPDENILGLTTNFPKHHDHIEVILTGSFFIRLLESQLWPFKSFRFWVFSSRIRNFLIQEFNFSADVIGLIGRKAESRVPALTSQKSLNLIYAGRLSLTKNITAIMRLVSHLQKNSARDVTLDIFGQPDDFPDESIGRYSSFSMSDVIGQLSTELDWSSPPVFHGYVEQSEWPRVKRANPIFISFSTSMYEDFGTAAQIAINAGWPCILSDWGGHADNPNSYLVPHSLIAQTREPRFIQESKTKLLANYILGLGESEQLSRGSESIIPLREIQREELHLCLNKFLVGIGPTILFSLRERMSYFADLPKGMDFFSRYHQALRNGLAREAIIVNDLVDTRNIKVNHNEHPFDVYFTREIFSHQSARRLSSYKKIIIYGSNSECKSVLAYLRNIIGEEIEIHLCIQDETTGSNQ
jgi:hypothetical protein